MNMYQKLKLVLREARNLKELCQRSYGLPVFANSVGVHAGSITLLADEVIGTRGLLGVIGSDAGHVAIADAGELPLGVITDEAEAAEDPVAVSLLSSASTTLNMVAAEAVTAGSLVYGAAGGKVSTLPSSAGNFYCVGLALSAASADGDLLEVEPCFPRVETVEP